MSYIKILNHQTLFRQKIIVRTQVQEWLIPSSSGVMRCLIEDQAINPPDLCFSSPNDCHCFIKQLLLLALDDEYKNFEPSPLAKFARELIKIRQNQRL